ncbi:sensor histidine kinase [Streptoalloteichus hindustanus]|uniref:histidine kinase n=1 Tax=Streptoalloteichus hindustanus TaxID=2017 RepID=A0A1M5JD78_STRHI|nr:sensor domain-containing protein [Streptoalloteichus hindustanus]SHG38249.1 Signal transduction histidine kinase [Streptoalloteichus hindustanus]
MTDTTAPTERSASSRPSALAALAYLLLSFPIGVFWFCLLLPLIVLSAGTTIVWVGVPLFAMTMVVWRGGAQFERLRLRGVGLDVPSPYRPLPSGGLFVRTRALMADPATWRDLAYLVLLFPLSIIEFVLVVALWAMSLGFLTLPVWFRFLPDGTATLFYFGESVGAVFVDSTAEALPWSVFGAAMLLLTVYLGRKVATGHRSLAHSLLRPTKAAELAARAEHLQTSRARGVDAAEAERRRIERDLHDGAQQRLVALAMDLGRAKAKLDKDPGGARELIEEAHVEAKQAIAELRDLARGIYPAVLADRGLDAALSALAARCPVPVHVTVELPQRPPAAVESIAYFTVAEALTNVAKYAEATTAAITVLGATNKVYVEIFDDGRGGATARPGGGLAGLADRAATIDGVVTVDSPPGGPTKIRAELPCVW